MFRYFFYATVVAFPLLSALGCGNQKAVYPVRGKIVDAEGKPLGGAAICLWPAENLEDNVKPAGYSDEEGTFTLTTYENDDGAPAGDYVVAVAWMVGPKNPEKPREPPPDRLKGKFVDPTTSPLHVTIDKGLNSPTIELPIKVEPVQKEK